jgi:hypothetical protein
MHHPGGQAMPGNPQSSALFSQLGDYADNSSMDDFVASFSSDGRWRIVSSLYFPNNPLAI